MFGSTQTQLGAATVIREAATLTSSYVGSTALDLLSYDSVVVLIEVDTAQTGKTCSLKFQWSNDNSTWADEPVDVAGSTSGSEQPFTPYSRVINISMDNAAATYMGKYICRLRRLARYFRVAVKSDATTTGKIKVSAVKLSNYN